MATLVLAGLLAGGGMLANNMRMENNQKRDDIIGKVAKDPTDSVKSSQTADYRKNIAAVLSRQIPNQRSLGQNIYNVDDYVTTEADLQARAEKVYPAAVQKENDGRRWGQSVLNGLDEGDGEWVHYASNPQKKQVEMGSFAAYPFPEQEYMKTTQLRKDGLPMTDSKRRFEQMTTIGTGGTGYRKKQEVLNVLNGGENPVSANVIDNIAMLNPEKSLATTFDGTHLSNSGVNGINDTNTLLKSYIATRKSTIDDKSVDPGLKTFAFDRFAGGNGQREFNAQAALPENYQVNHRRNVQGTTIDGLQQARAFQSSMPQGYNHHEITQSLDSNTKANKNRLTQVTGRLGNAIVAQGQQGPNMGNIQSSGGYVPQTVLPTGQRRQDLSFADGRFTQVQLNRPAPDKNRYNVIVPQTRKEETLFSHTGGISNMPQTTASYLSRVEPMQPTNKQLLLRSSQGAAIQHAMPQHSMYEEQMQDWKRDLHYTNSNAYEASLYRTPGAYVPGDHTRQLPNAPRITNKQLHSQEIGDMGPIGGAQSFVDAATPRGWQTVSLSNGPEFVGRQPDLTPRYDINNEQLNAQENAIAASYKKSKLDEISGLTHAGVVSQANPVEVRMNNYRDAWHAASRRPK